MSYTSVYPVAHNSTYIKTTSPAINSNYAAWWGTDPALIQIGIAWPGISWFTSSLTNEKFNIDLGAGEIVTRLLLVNFHDSGSTTTVGIKTVIIYGTNSATAFANTAYSDLTDLTLVGSFTASVHTSIDEVDPQYFDLSSNSTAYQYYVLRVADNHGGTYGMGFRHIELQTGSTVVPSDPIYTVGDSSRDNLNKDAPGNYSYQGLKTLGSGLLKVTR